MTDLHIEARPCPGVPQAVEVVVHGQINTAAVHRFIEAVDGALVGRVSILLLGMKEVTSVVSVSLSYLADLFARLERRGGAIALVNTDPKIRIIFSSLGLHAFFTFFETFEDARAFARTRAEETRRLPRLLAANGPWQGAEFPVLEDVPVVIGGDPEAAIRVESMKIERRHAEVYRRGEGCRIRDLGTKGVFIGARRIADDPLAPGDTIRVGELELKYLAPGDAGQSLDGSPEGH